MCGSLCDAAARELNQYVNSIKFRGDKKEMPPYNVVSFFICICNDTFHWVLYNKTIESYKKVFSQPS